MSGDADVSARFARVRALFEDGIRARAFPAATVEVGRSDGAIWRDAFGTLSYAVDAALCTTGTIFDLASLTKVIAVASVAMRHVRHGRLALDTPVAKLSAAWSGDERRGATVRHLLDHSSGLPAHARLFEFARDRDGFEREIGRTPLAQPPGAAAVYSDLGFMLLGFILERLGGAALDRQIADLAAALGEPLMFTPPPELRRRIAPTEIDAWRGRLLVGDVHDENAAALGGVAGHAGLFGTSGAVGAFARLVLETFARETRLGTPALMRTFAARSDVPGSSRALAWDTMKPTSSCGPLMSPTAIGHTGFTGTSVWIDWEQDLYVVILTNRVHPSREPNLFAPMRRVLHTAIVDGLRP